MTTRFRRSARCCFLACIVLVLLGTASCQPAPLPAPTATPVPPTITPVPTATAGPRPPISAADVRAIAAPFDKLSKAYIQAWNTHDIENMRRLLVDDLSSYEASNNPKPYAQNLLTANSMVLDEEPNFEGRQAGIFINRDSAFDIWEMWNYNADVRPSSPEDPIVAFDWYTLRDGKIATMWLMWESEFLKASFGVMGVRLYGEVLQSYGNAWSSGDPQAVAELYAPDAVRHDALFGADQTGPAAIQKFASSFFSGYPGLRFERLQSFQLGESKPVKTGGLYVLHTQDQAGKPCDIRTIILLEALILDDRSAGKLINEWWFYEPDSLIACGWAA